MEEDWASGTIKEVPFWRDDMTVEEYEKERVYLIEHWKDFQNNTYKPLWQQ